jgi:hypothetical protein
MKTNWLLSAGFVLIFTYFSALADSLDNWHWRNPLPNGNLPFGPHSLNSVIYTNGEFIAVGDTGVVCLSTNGTNWTESLTATTINLNSIIYGNGLFVAAGADGIIETSTNGTNWVIQNSGTTGSLDALAYANGEYVAVGTNTVICSPDAVYWTSAVSGIEGATAVVGGATGFVAIPGNSEPYFGPNSLVYFSEDGLVWTSRTLTVPGTPFGGAQSQNEIVSYFNGLYLIGSSLFVSSESANACIFSSPDGSTWSTNLIGNVFTGSSGFSYAFFMAGNGRILAAGSASFPFLQFSTDGINWQQTNNLPDSLQQGAAGAYGNGTYVIMPLFLTSTDGLNWVSQAQPATPPFGPGNNFSGITYSNDTYVVAGANYVVQSTNGLVYTIASNTPALSSVTTFGSTFMGVGAGGTIYQSGDGLSWTQRNSGTLNNLHSVTAGGSLAVAVGDDGTIQTSPCGTVWTSRTSGTSLALFGVTYSNNLYVAVGQEGTVLTSPDGINWTGQYSGQLTNLLSVTYGSAEFLAAGLGGTILTSPDGVNWTSQSAGVSTAFESAAFGNGYYLLAGLNSLVVTSPDGVNWTARNIGTTGGQNLYGAAFLNGRFDVVGAGGTLLESDPIAPLFDIQTHANGNWLTAFAPPGSNFRIQMATNLLAPVWIDAASFNNSTAITQWTNTAAQANQLFYRAVSP